MRRAIKIVAFGTLALFTAPVLAGVLSKAENVRLLARAADVPDPDAGWVFEGEQVEFVAEYLGCVTAHPAAMVAGH